ncbi:hypothetical protein QYZ88_001620 [Lachnospiraceae bacterium C1.1]|nr:hypothetical protein [Lachnospiraceae bacterium C1.1]
MSMDKKKPLKTIIKLLITFLIAFFLGATLIIAVFNIPIEQIRKNASESAAVFAEEGVYPKLYRNTTSTLDNFTDALMILNAINDTNESVINRAMNVYQYDFTKDGAVNALLNYFSGADSKPETTTYARYWHGYLVLLKPALFFTTYSNIRKINLLLHICLLLTISLFWIKLKKPLYIVPFLLSYGSIMPIANAYSMQFATCAYIILISVLILLIKNAKWKEKKDGYYICFLLVGMATSYFDYFTYPATTFGVLIVVYLVLNADAANPFEAILDIVRNGFVWVIGYAGMWISKWVLASVLLNKDFIKAGIGAANSRSSLNSNSEMGEYSLGLVIKINFNNWTNSPITQLLIIFVIVAFLYVILRGKDVAIRNSIFIFLPIMLIPFVWYICIGNHSFVHNWFTYKELIIFGFVLSCIPIYALENVDHPALRKNLKKEKINKNKNHK